MRVEHQNQAWGPPEHGPCLIAQVTHTMNLALHVMTSILESHLGNYPKNKWITMGRRRGYRRGYRKMILVIQACTMRAPTIFVGGMKRSILCWSNTSYKSSSFLFNFSYFNYICKLPPNYHLNTTDLHEMKIPSKKTFIKKINHRMSLKDCVFILC